MANLSEPAAVVRALNEGSTDSRPIISVRGRNRCGTESGLPFFHPTNGDAHRNSSTVNSTHFAAV